MSRLRITTLGRFYRIVGNEKYIVRQLAREHHAGQHNYLSAVAYIHAFRRSFITAGQRQRALDRTHAVRRMRTSYGRRHR